ncbi:hypothetical protein [uncultured Agitococcus sp.]|uniref:hypothetical protein n=1 Tax=uncultured Agitococcus sp. TaxID=1506599 RepID=UPI002630E001|nr:hypothetical protein [uncultured Agitococcus sp.]
MRHLCMGIPQLSEYQNNMAACLGSLVRLSLFHAISCFCRGQHTNIPTDHHANACTI